jgi:predicted nuclease of predicted toxin-antitoxin system
MPKPFYKHKTLLDEQLYHRRMYPLLNEHFDVKHIRDDLHLGGLPDPAIYELALKQGRIILTKMSKTSIHSFGKTPLGSSAFQKPGRQAALIAN